MEGQNVEEMEIDEEIEETMTKEEILSLNVKELREKLEEFQLSTVGRKIILQDRLLTHYGYNDDESEAESVESTEIAEPIVKPVFTLKDIRDSVTYFNGSNATEIKNWLVEFEDCAIAVHWNELQKFIYGRQLLKGAAQSFIRSQANITSWAQLKKALIKEFGNKLSAAEIHQMLKSKKKMRNESCLEFLYRLMEISKPLNLDEESLIEYFSEGIRNKFI